MKKKRNISTKRESIFDQERRLKAEAIAIAKSFVSDKPIKYLLK